MHRLAAASILLALLLPACDETDVVSVRVRVRQDFSGTVATSGLTLPAFDAPIQQESRGATWESRVSVLCAAGRFERVADLRLGDLVFAGGEGAEGLCFVRVLLPRGESAIWHRALSPLTADERAEASAALDPTGKAADAGETVKIEVELPSAVIGNGVTGKTRGMKSSSDGAVATLLVPLDSARSAGNPIVWHLTWQK